VLRSTRLRRSRIVCVRAPSQHTPKTPWKEEVVSFSLDDDARRRRREANARRRPDGTATNAYIVRARVDARSDCTPRTDALDENDDGIGGTWSTFRFARSPPPSSPPTTTFALERRQTPNGPNGGPKEYGNAYLSELWIERRDDDVFVRVRRRRGRDSQRVRVRGGAKRRARGRGRDAAVGRKGDGT